MVIYLKLINYDQIENNILTIKKTNDIILVVKNDAYGFGLKKVVEIALRCGVDKFAVNTIEEAILLRKITDKYILLFGYSIKHIQRLIIYNIIPTASSYNEITIYNKFKIKYELEIDSGMNRFGIKGFNDKYLSDEYLFGVYTHFYKESIIDYNLISLIKRECNKHNKHYHFGGSMLYLKTNDTIRIGRLAYSDAISLYGNVVMLKIVNKDECVGYDSLYRALKNEIIAIVDIGYYNGLRVNYNGYVYINKNRYQTVGKICMNHCFILVDSSVNIGDKVEFFGENINIDEFLSNNNMTEYECFLSIR